MSAEFSASAPDASGPTAGAGTAPAESLTGIAHPEGRFDRALALLPRALASKTHVVFLIALGIYLIVLPLAHILTPSATTELIGGNYTNVTSDVGACIAAGGTLHLVRANRRRSRMEEERLRLARETHRLLHHVYADRARELGHDSGDDTGPPLPGPE
ncbi:hypothetical protein [Streptomyces sp. NPDC050485]|uniref:hypothetical protein n=1 Tax=Streptomyces sp. NPDC050485 TaxID=3365617 RepID=UPI0037A7F140